VPSLGDEGLIYWSYKWRQAAERVQRGESPLPESGRLQPKACWVDLQRVMSGNRWHPCHKTPQTHEPEPLADDWRAELERHSKCSPDFCRVSLRPRRAGRVIGS
jgi:hypothetical protein